MPYPEVTVVWGRRDFRATILLGIYPRVHPVFDLARVRKKESVFLRRWYLYGGRFPII